MEQTDGRGRKRPSRWNRLKQINQVKWLKKIIEMKSVDTDKPSETVGNGSSK
jgi:hypothetical protein